MSKSTCLMFAAVTASLLLVGCSGSSTPPTAATTAVKAQPQAAASTHIKTPWDPLLKDRAKAKAVQKTMDAYAKKQQQAINKATGQ